MIETQGFAKSQNYVGRQPQRELVIEWARRVDRGEGGCHALYFQAGGGLGKTFLLEKYPEFVVAVAPNMLVARIIDLYSYEKRSASAIEDSLIAGIKRVRPDQKWRLSAHEVDQAFAAYTKTRHEYEYQHPWSNREERTISEGRLRDVFITCWNNLAQSHPLTMCFDTLEVLFSSEKAPPEALVMAAKAVVGDNPVIRWMAEVLPKLQRTLVLLSGRPLDDPNPVVEMLREHHLLEGEVQTLLPFTDPEEIRDYLKEYNIEIPDDQIWYVQRITSGQPLLLTCYVELQRIRWANVLTQLENDTYPNRAEFERLLIATILNPYQAQSPADRIFIFTLYFLAYARRGLRRDDLYTLLRIVGIHPEREEDHQVIQKLNERALVKTMRRPSITAPAKKTMSQDDEPDDLLFFLHDEMYQLIDGSGKPAEISLPSKVLKYLSDSSREHVQVARDKHLANDLLKGMSDHIYYELTRDVVELDRDIAHSGFFTYHIYVDLMLRERKIDEAIILSDTFWSTITYALIRDGQRVQPYRNMLREYQSDDGFHGNLYDEVLYSEQVLFIKLLRAIGDNLGAIEYANRLYDMLVARRLLPSATEPLNLQAPLANQYLWVDLSLARGIAMVQAGRAGADAAHTQGKNGADRAVADHDDKQRQSSAKADTGDERMFSDVIELLQHDHLIVDPRLRSRHKYLLGLAYTQRGQFHYDQQRIRESLLDAEQGRLAFQQYLSEGEDKLNDSVVGDLAQVTNNLAYNLALSGNLKQALKLSNDVLKKYLSKASDYQRALFYNTNALIRIQLGEFSYAEEPLERAEQAARLSGSDRALGKVSQARGQLEGALMKLRRKPNRSIWRRYQIARKLLANEPPARREVYYDWAGLERDLARFYRELARLYREEKKPDQERRYAQLEKRHVALALALLNLGLELTKQPSIHWANLVAARIAIHVNHDDFEQADAELEDIERVLKEPEARDTLPEYGQVVCGKIALQRGYIMMDSQGDYQEGLKYFAIALARTILFAEEHRDRDTFQQLIVNRIENIRDTEELRRFQRSIEDKSVNVSVRDLPYLRPKAKVWARAWKASTDYLNNAITEWLTP